MMRYVGWMSLMVIVAAACSPKSRPQDCSYDNDCAAGEACIDGSCKEVECKQDTDCPEGEYCKDHACLPEVQCTGDGDCASDEICQGGTCTQVECKQDADCPQGEICVDHACEVDTTCTDDGDCAADEICQAGTCTRVDCKLDQDCALQERCVDHQCVPGPECTTDDHCDPGQICEAEECVVGCRSDRDCPTGFTCLEDQGAHGSCVECTLDGDCAAGERCINHACVPYCEGNNDCAVGYCDLVSHQCVECIADGHCPAGHICQNRTCVAGCRNDDGCDPGEICEDSACRTGCRQGQDCPSGICDQLTLTCIECLDKDDCPLGHLCIGQLCVPGCEDDRDCPEGIACAPDIGPHGTCVECESDDDCLDPDLPRCENYACAPECTTDEHCPVPGEFCVDNHCQPLAQECDLRIEPEGPLAFGPLQVGRAATLVVNLSNQGGAPCDISQLELNPSLLYPSDFEIVTGPQAPFALEPRGEAGSEVEVEIEFAPGVDGNHSATLWITSNDPDLLIGAGDIACFYPAPPVDGQACIRVTGQGVFIDVEAIPAHLEFGPATVGCSSATETVRFYNLGESVGVTDIFLGDPNDPNFAIVTAPAVPFTLGTDAMFEVEVRYQPQATGSHVNTLVIAFDDPGVADLEVWMSGTGSLESDASDLFMMPPHLKMDVLWVVDNSGTMGEEQAALAENFYLFIQWALNLGVDFHIGVVATEVNEAETGMGSPPRDIVPGVLVNAPGRPKVLSSATPELETAFAENVSLGTCCSDEQEAGLQASWMALSDPLLSDENAGFLRSDAKLYIIYVSDETDQSQGPPGFYADYFLDLKGHVEWVTLSAICGDLPSGCWGNMGEAEAAPRYHEVMNLTGGIFQSICQEDWSGMMTELGEDAFAPIRTFSLTRPADPATIVVWVNESIVPEAGCFDCPNGWTYHPATNSIYFGDHYLPPYGATIEVHYTADCL